MKYSYLFLFMFFICSCQVKKEEKLSFPFPALNYLETKVQSWIDNGYYDGIAVEVVKDNQMFFKSAYGGYNDTTSIHVASAGKWIAAATIAAIVDEGKLSWNDPVKKYLPEFKGAKGEATLKELLSHTAGYPDYQPEGKKRDDYQTLVEAVKHIVDLPADTIPGTKFRYGGLAMQVAGRMAEIVTEKDWETLFQEKIAHPLNMNHSSFVPVSLEGGFNPMLGGGFKTCLRDYMNFLKMFANEGMFEGRQVLTINAINEIEADQIRDAKVNQPEFVLNARQNKHNEIYGLGLWREEIADNESATLISSPGWAGAYPWIDKKNHIYGFCIAKVKRKAFSEGFSSFYGSAVLPLLIRDVVMQMDYPAELKKRKIDIGDAQLYYEELGKGTPILFIHGHSLNHTMWDKQFFEFAKSFRAIRYDIRGYGYSSPQTETEQFTHVEDLVKLMDALRIEKAHIVGLSLGGYIGVDMLGWFPDRVLSAVLASGNVRPLPKPSIPMDEQEVEKRNLEISALKKKGVDVMKREWFNGLMQSGGTQKERMRKPLWNMIYQWDAWQPLHKEVRVIAGGDAYDKLRINCPDMPVMILEGKSEHNRFPSTPEILKYLPNGYLEIIEDAGHMLNMERPEEFNEVVLNFINKNK